MPRASSSASTARAFPAKPTAACGLEPYPGRSTATGWGRRRQPRLHLPPVSRGAGLPVQQDQLVRAHIQAYVSAANEIGAGQQGQDFADGPLPAGWLRPRQGGLDLVAVAAARA